MALRLGSSETVVSRAPKMLFSHVETSVLRTALSSIELEHRAHCERRLRRRPAALDLGQHPGLGVVGHESQHAAAEVRGDHAVAEQHLARKVLDLFTCLRRSRPHRHQVGPRRHLRRDRETALEDVAEHDLDERGQRSLSRFSRILSPEAVAGGVGAVPGATVVVGASGGFGRFFWTSGRSGAVVADCNA